MKNLVNQIYPLMNKYTTRLTPNDNIQALLQQLRPMNCGMELVRVGPPGDGGYLLPDDLDGLDACFSPGVADTSSFEKECAGRGMEIFMADYSVEGPAEAHERFHFEKKFIGALREDHFIRLEDWTRASRPAPHGDFLLQMDIEGGEYEVLLDAPIDLLNQFRIMVIEFHSLKNLWSKPFFSLASRAFQKLLQTHVCVHNHPNNSNTFKKIGAIEMPSVTEMTFLRLDRVRELSPATTFPHPLDCDNSNRPSRALPACWYPQP